MLETHRLVEHNRLARAFAHYEELYGEAAQDKTFAEVLRESLFAEIKRDFNTELFDQPLLCDELRIDNARSPPSSATNRCARHRRPCGIESGQGELLAFKHLYGYDFSRMSQDIMGAVYERFLAHKLLQDGGRIVIEDTDELRKKEGIYYTPRYIVDYIVEHTLGEKIKPSWPKPSPCSATRITQRPTPKSANSSTSRCSTRPWVPARFCCAPSMRWSGLRRYNEACRRAKADRERRGHCCSTRPPTSPRKSDAPLHVLTENIFGVDLDAQAVEVAKLSLWLRYMALNRDSFRDRLRSGRAAANR